MHLMDDELVVGDGWDWQTSVDGYPATDGWTLKYRIIPPVAGTPITLTAVTASDGTSYRVTVAPATTAAYIAGDYSWYAWVEKSGARVTIDDGLVTIKGDPNVITTFDARTDARKVLDQLMAAYQSFTSSNGTIKEYSIGSRRMVYQTSTDILKDIDYWKNQVANEDALEKMRDGLGNPRNIGIRFSRV